MKQGNVEIMLPNKESCTICFTQVGSMENGEFVLEYPFEQSGVNLNMLRTANQLEKAASKLEKYVTEGFLVETDSEGVAKIDSLDEGVYLLDSESMLPTLLFLPTWDEVEQKMLYDITIVPKYGSKPPQTGDEANFGGWFIVLLFSAMILIRKIAKSIKKEDCF